MSLARLLGKRGRHDEARTMLAAIYDWFTEGIGHDQSHRHGIRSPDRHPSLLSAHRPRHEATRPVNRTI